LNDLLMDWIVNEGVESARGRTAVGKRVIAVGGMALANNQTMAATDNTRTNTGSISEEDTGDSSLPKRHANRDFKRRVSTRASSINANHAARAARGLELSVSSGS
jgi:hypothetical protein